MFIPVWLIEQTFFIQYYARDRFVYHVGYLKSIDEGIRGFQEHLKQQGQIIIDEPEMVTYLDHNQRIIFVILYRSLSKLEYLEYLWEKSVGNNPVYRASK